MLEGLKAMLIPGYTKPRRTRYAFKRHQGVRERSRRMTQILEGKIDANSLARGKQTQYFVQGLAARIRAGMGPGRDDAAPKV